MLGASAQPIAASKYAAKPISKIGRLPQRSDSGPHTSCDRPNANSKALKVYCAWLTGAPKLAVNAGSAGKYRSVVTG